MDFTDDAIVLSARRHGEANLVLAALTREHGRHLGLVKGGASRRQRPNLEIGNRLKVTWHARLEEQLGAFTVEPVGAVSAQLLDDPLRLAGLASACAVADTVLPEREPHEDVFTATAALIDAIVGEGTSTPHPIPLPQGEREIAHNLSSHPRAELADRIPSPLEGEGKGEGSKILSDKAFWLAAYVRWELALLTALGFGLDLSRCAVTGDATNLAYVSPKSGRAVSVEAGQGYRDRLLPLPAFLIADRAPDRSDLLAGLRLTGFFLDRHALHGPQAKGSSTARRMEARQRFLERLSAMKA